MDLINEEIESLNIKDYKIIQSSDLYRFTSDAILLSRFAKANDNEVVADICAGSGIVGLHFFALNEEKVKSVTLFEMQKSLSDMSKRSVKLNALEDKFTVENCKIQDIDETFFGKFSLVLCNPPYKKQNSGYVSLREDIAVCKHEITVNIEDIAKSASKLLKRGGRICLCNKCERLLDVLSAFEKFGLCATRLAFLSGEKDKPPYLFFIEAVNKIKRPFKVEKPIINDVVRL